MSPARGPVRAVPDLDAQIRTGVYKSGYAVSPSLSPETFGNVTPIKKDSAELQFGIEDILAARPLGYTRTVPPVPPAAAAPPAAPECSGICGSQRVLEDIRDAINDLRAELGRVR